MLLTGSEESFQAGVQPARKWENWGQNFNYIFQNQSPWERWNCLSDTERNKIIINLYFIVLSVMSWQEPFVAKWLFISASLCWIMTMKHLWHITAVCEVDNICKPCVRWHLRLLAVVIHRFCSMMNGIVKKKKKCKCMRQKSVNTSVNWLFFCHSSALSPNDFGYRVAVMASFVSSGIILFMSVAFITCCLLDCIKEEERKKEEKWVKDCWKSWN